MLFSFRVYLDDKVRSPQRDLLFVGGQPVGVRKVDLYTVQFDLAEPYAGAERLFDSVAMLPRPDWLPVDSEILAALDVLAARLSRRGAHIGAAQPEGFAIPPISGSPPSP